MTAALPDDAILLHIGVHKTGSTALQAALAAARPALAERGIRYPGRDEAHHAAAWAVTGFRMGFGDEATSVRPRTWTSLVKSARRHRGRVVISSEFFGRLNRPAARRVVAELGADRVHVLVGVRRLADLLPSSWQQYLKSGLTVTYKEWLRDVLGKGAPQTTHGFWRRADFDALVRRWARIVPPERITAVVLAPGERDLLFRTAEGLLDLPASWLDPYRRTGRDNRSMTAPEAEAVRRLNEHVSGRIGWTDYNDHVRHGAIADLVTHRIPPPDEPPLLTPPWALRRARSRQQRDYRRITRSGITVVGDVEVLRTLPRGGYPPQVSAVPADIAAYLTTGAAHLRLAEPGAPGST